MGKVAKIKTVETDASVEDFINTVTDEEKRKDSFLLIKLMESATKEKAKLWGSSIIGFGKQRVKSPATGREVDWLKIGFSPRKANLSLYLTGHIQSYESSLKKLGKHKTGVGCLYINKFSDVDMKVLEDLISEAANRNHFS